MKLSEAIRLGAMTGPQIRGRMIHGNASCTIGAACIALGIDHVDAHLMQKFKSTFPWVSESIIAKIVDRNDFLGETREEIADWIATLESEEDARKVAEEHESKISSDRDSCVVGAGVGGE